jgi:hypothetical protein
MPELKAAHLRLNEAMKAEQTFIAEAFASPQLAA